MNSVMEVIRKTGLFLFGVVLIVWGYRANAATNNEGPISVKGGISPILKALEKNLKQQQEAGQAEDSGKKEKPVKTNKVSLPIEKKKEEDKETKIEARTVIEKETPEKSSGTK
ncbi:hypothetical protein FACS1894179_08200 [Bacteroidia bacterium]|nr:hypothetical protein FACS1894179_08200 [Bacteroidia bacterium]